MTVAKWALGKQLYFDGILSSDGIDLLFELPRPEARLHGSFAVLDRHPRSQGRHERPDRFQLGLQRPCNSGMAGPCRWRTRPRGRCMNPVEMFSGEDHAWNSAVLRVRRQEKYVKQFRAVFGTDPTRDGIAKAIATYERTVLSGNSIHDRAELAMRVRAEDEGTGKFEFKAKDYETVLKAAFDAKDNAGPDRARSGRGKGRRESAGRGAEPQRRPGAVLRQGALQ